MKTILTISLLILISLTANANASSADAENFIKYKQSKAFMLNKEASQRVESLRANRGKASVEAGINVRNISEIEPAAGNKIDATQPAAPKNNTPATSETTPADKQTNTPAKVNNAVTKGSGVI